MTIVIFTNSSACPNMTIGNSRPAVPMNKPKEIPLDQDLVTSLAIPPRPKVLGELFAEMSRDDPDLARAATMIAADPALAGAMVKAVNSAAFGLSRKVGSVSQALSLLGLRNVANIAMSLAIRHAIRGDAGSSMERFWDTAERVALISARLAREFRGLPPDEAYTIGLFHDCGIPLLMRRFPDYVGILTEANRTPGTAFTTVEDQAFRTNHAVVGYFLARSWDLPADQCEAIQRHHDSALFSETSVRSGRRLQDLVGVVHLAEHVHHRAARDGFDLEWDKFEGPVLRHFGMHEEDLADIIEEFAAYAA